MQLDQKLAEKLKLALVALPPTHLKKHWGRGDENGTLLRVPAEYPSRSEKELNVSYYLYLRTSHSKWKGGGILLQYYFTTFIFNERTDSCFFSQKENLKK